MESQGELKDILVQSHVPLTSAKIVYIADFKAFDLKLNETVWYEYKGFETDVWKIKKRLWKHYGPGRLRIFYANGRCEEIAPA